jgi:hypothetical protein
MVSCGSASAAAAVLALPLGSSSAAAVTGAVTGASLTGASGAEGGRVPIPSSTTGAFANGSIAAGALGDAVDAAESSVY